MVLLHRDIVMLILVELIIIGLYGFNCNDNFIYYDPLKYNIYDVWHRASEVRYIIWQILNQQY